jgi:hypothetical protein
VLCLKPLRHERTNRTSLHQAQAESVRRHRRSLANEGARGITRDESSSSDLA